MRPAAANRWRRVMRRQDDFDHLPCFRGHV